jgi:hypothetical protein
LRLELSFTSVRSFKWRAAERREKETNLFMGVVEHVGLLREVLKEVLKLDGQAVVL